MVHGFMGNTVRGPDVIIFSNVAVKKAHQAQRYFKERAIHFQFANLAEKGLSRGELNRVKAILCPTT
jgi:arsenate reductase (glutaredoxin)